MFPFCCCGDSALKPLVSFSEWVDVSTEWGGSISLTTRCGGSDFVDFYLSGLLPSGVQFESNSNLSYSLDDWLKILNDSSHYFKYSDGKIVSEWDLFYLSEESGEYECTPPKKIKFINKVFGFKRRFYSYTYETVDKGCCEDIINV